MTDRTPGILHVSGLTGWRLAFGLYLVGYFVYLGLHLYWGARDGVEPYIGFVLWHALLYGPLWPLLLIARITGVVVATV